MAGIPDADALPDLDDLLQCPVCYEVPTGQIYQCNEGHHVCGRCKARLEVCPVCRSMFFGTRNYVMEELITKIRNLNAFKLAGKTTVITSSEGEASADTSIVAAGTDPAATDGSGSDDTRASTSSRPPQACKGLFRCLCCKPGHAERLPAGRLLNHLRYFHGHELIEGKSEDGEYLQVWQLNPDLGRQAVAIRVADMGIFYLILEITDSSLHAWVVMAAAAFVSHEFVYTVTVTGGNREIVFTDCVWSVRSCEGTLKKRSRCLEARGADAAAVRATTTLSARLLLKRCPQDLPLAALTSPRTVVRVASLPTPPQEALPQVQPQRLSRNARRRRQNALPPAEPIQAPDQLTGHTRQRTRR